MPYVKSEKKAQHPHDVNMYSIIIGYLVCISMVVFIKRHPTGLICKFSGIHYFTFAYVLDMYTYNFYSLFFQ